jgi:hypothetical protein
MTMLMTPAVLGGVASSFVAAALCFVAVPKSPLPRTSNPEWAAATKRYLELAPREAASPIKVNPL